MGNYTLILLAFGIMFSLYYIKESNTFGKIITAIFAVFYGLTYFKFSAFNLQYLYLVGLVLAVTYAFSQKQLATSKTYAIAGFSVLLIAYSCMEIVGVDLLDFKMLLFFPLAVFAYIFYNKEEYENEMSFLNLMFVNLLMTINRLLNS